MPNKSNAIPCNARGVLLVALSLSPLPVFASSDCWLDVYDQTNYQGAHVRIEGPAELPSLRGLKGENWSDRIDSLVVGPKAQVLAFRQENYKEGKIAMPYHGEALKAWGESPKSYSDEEITFGAGHKEHHLGELNFHRNINSLKIRCLP